MALPPEPSLVAFHVVATVVPCIALLVTVFRITYRYQRKLWWWDDAFVALASLFMVLLVVGVWLFSAPPGANLSQKLKIVAYYLCTHTFTIANYAARLSILFGIIRVAPNPITRRVLKAVAALFGVIAAVLISQKIWVCDGGDQSWKLQDPPSCHLGLQVSITELVTDIICDAILIIAPLHFLHGSHLKPSQKRRVYAIFLASVATTITSIVQDWLIFAAGGLREETASMIEVSVAIIVANLPVIVSVCFRMFSSSGARARTNGMSHTTSDEPNGVHRSSRFPKRLRRGTNAGRNGPGVGTTGDDSVLRSHGNTHTIQLTSVPPGSFAKLESMGFDGLRSWEEEAPKRSIGRFTDSIVEEEDGLGIPPQKRKLAPTEKPEVGIEPSLPVHLRRVFPTTTELGALAPPSMYSATNAPFSPPPPITPPTASSDVSLIPDHPLSPPPTHPQIAYYPPPSPHHHRRVSIQYSYDDTPYAHATTIQIINPRRGNEGDSISDEDDERQTRSLGGVPGLRRSNTNGGAGVLVRQDVVVRADPEPLAPAPVLNPTHSNGGAGHRVSGRLRWR